MAKELTVVDLFCGAGGLSLGFSRVGFSVIAAYDSWLPAVDTYRENIGDHIRNVSITRDLDVPRATVIAGGPPCQGFSSAGLRKDGDTRNSLVGEFSQLIAKSRPDAFVFENVEGFLTGGGGRYVLELLGTLIDAGYRIHLRKVNAAHYGVPQHRKRVIAIGGLGWDPTFPEPTHKAHGAPGANLANLSSSRRSPTLAEALEQLPPAISMDANLGPADHTIIALSGDDLARARLLKQGQRMRDLPEDMWHQSYKKRAFRRVMDGTPSERRGGAPAGIRRLRSDEPSKAITGGALREFLHPVEDRPLTIKECATLQTFPITFNFRGSQSDKIQLIGNAVPPTFAEAVARSLYQDLLLRESTSHIGGALLSFVPTLSFGMSPALEHVVRCVRSKFSQESKRVQATLWD